MVIAAQRVADANSRISLIRCTPDGHVENVQRFSTAAAYTLNTTITADEIFSLHGARKRPASSRYMEQLEEQVPVLWDFFREFRSDWNEITAFFANRGTGTSELFLRNIRIDGSTVFKPYSRKLDKSKWNALALGKAFAKLQKHGIIQDLSTEEYLPGRLILLLGGMKELGAVSRAAHAETLDTAKKQLPDAEIITIGKEFSDFSELPTAT
jgi:hypothetical protein